MHQFSWLQKQIHIHRTFTIRFTALLVGAHGVFILAVTLLDQLAIHRGSRLSAIVIDVPLLIGLSLLYLANLLRRRKQNAWFVTIAAYTFYLGISISALLTRIGIRDIDSLEIIRAVVLPVSILCLLLVVRKEFTVRSDFEGFKWATQFSIVILVAALLYGVVGFELLDRSDFHQEISFGSAIHYTVDQFDLTTKRPIRPYTKRAHVFTDSLSFVSTAAVVYVVISLFQPLRIRLSDQTVGRQRLHALLLKYGGHSEDYFKLWPHDKLYFFDNVGTSGLAFHVYRGVALCLGDPVGDPKQYRSLLNNFAALCYGNDWLPAFVHVQNTHQHLYEQFDYSLQKIGQEAVVDIPHFQAEVARNKYFRHITNKFTKQGYSAELLQPPHHAAVLDRLQAISAEWLDHGSRTERGFAMGYYTSAYMQQGPVMVVRDAAGTIQAFLNQLPADFDEEEITYDLLRQTSGSMSNTLDFLLLHFINQAEAAGYKRLNLGLCPLVGLDAADADKGGLIDNILRFTYENGDRFYSFSGLYRFKSKYEPEWRPRYMAYQGGVRGFSRSMTALVRTMRVKSSKS